MSFNMQPFGPVALQTSEEKQMGMFLHLSGACICPGMADRDGSAHNSVADAKREDARPRRSRQDGHQLDDLGDDLFRG